MPIVPKFVDIVVNGMSERAFEVKAYAQDQYGVSKRTKYLEDMLVDMKTKDFNNAAKDKFGIDLLRCLIYRIIKH